jgi:hypothetical protein
VIGLFQDRLFQRGDGVVRAIEPSQRRAAREKGIGVVGVDGQRAIGGRQRLGVPRGAA